MFFLSLAYLFVAGQQITVSVEQLVSHRPEVTGDQLAAGFSLGDGGTAVAGLPSYVLLAKLRCLAQGGQLLAQGQFHGCQLGRVLDHCCFPLVGFRLHRLQRPVRGA